MPSRYLVCSLIFHLACPGSGPVLDPATDGGSGDAPMVDAGIQPIERIDCDDLIAGPDWHANPPAESAGGEVEGRLAGMTFDGLPEQIDISGLPAMFRGQIAYALDTPVDQLGATLARDAVQAQGPLGPVVLGALLLGREGAGFDFLFYRQGLQRYYACARAFPLRLEDLKSSLDVQLSEAVDITPSAAKCVTRRIQEDESAGYYQAETVVDGEVRETEVLLSGRADGNLDFVVYGADGLLNDRSRFPTIGEGQHVTVGSPYACMTCHFDADEDPSGWTYRVLFPDGTGPCRE